LTLPNPLVRRARGLATRQVYVPVILPVDFCNGLAQLRSHGRSGIRSIGVTTDGRDVAVKSKFCTPWIVDSGWSDSTEFLADLISLGEVLAGRGFLSVSSEQFIEFASEFQDQIESVFSVPVNLRNVARLQDKAVQARIARAAGLAVPASTTIPEGLSIEQDSVKGLRFPLFVRAQRHAKDFYAETGLQGVVANDLNELRHLRRRLPKKYPLLVQEYIDDGTRTDFCISGLSLGDGDVVAYSYTVVRQIRRYGSSSLNISQPMPQELDGIREFLRISCYDGPFDALFLRPEGEKHGLFIEINLRFWKSHGLAQRCGLDLPRVQALSFLRANTFPIGTRGYQYGVRWWLVLSDLAVSVRLMRQKRIGLREFMRSLGSPFTSGIGAWDDPLPEVYNTLSLRWRLRREAVGGLNV
jgi:predicted ATP-grasp superfamily ATP-dependent carboligase